MRGLGSVHMIGAVREVLDLKSADSLCVRMGAVGSHIGESDVVAEDAVAMDEVEKESSAGVCWAELDGFDSDDSLAGVVRTAEVWGSAEEQDQKKTLSWEIPNPCTFCLIALLVWYH